MQAYDVKRKRVVNTERSEGDVSEIRNESEVEL